MTYGNTSLAALGIAIVLGLITTASGVDAQEQTRDVTLSSAKVSLAGTSNIHAFTAATTTARLLRAQIAAPAGAAFWDEAIKPGALQAFEIEIPAATLSSPKEGLDKNMHKALKVGEFPVIAFRLTRTEAKSGAPNVLRAVGVLKVAGVEREVAFDLITERAAGTLVVKGEVPLLMTDFGITPPKAMLGMLKTDNQITVTFETVLAMPQTTN